jgi:FlaA1/EpsC-like NDP-sugar epimerase
MDRRLQLALGLDTFFVVLFVAVGRREHERDSAIAGLIGTAAPFVIALAISWLALRAWQRPTDWTTGVGNWVITLVVGMLLRSFVFGDGTAMSFVIVATAFLALFLIGWRVVFAMIERRSPGIPAGSVRATNSGRGAV